MSTSITATIAAFLGSKIDINITQENNFALTLVSETLQ